MADYRNANDYRNYFTYQEGSSDSNFFYTNPDVYDVALPYGSSNSAIVPIAVGIRKTAIVYTPAITGSNAVTAKPATLAATGAILDNFYSENSATFFPDTVAVSGLTLDNFVSEFSVIFEPDTAEAITVFETPFIPFTGVISPLTLQCYVVIEQPTIFQHSTSSTVFPETLETSSLIPFPRLEKGPVDYELIGDTIGFALMATCGITINRPEEVDRLIRNLRTVHINTDEYRLFEGRPVSVPKWDLPVPVLVSSMGHFLTDRETPEAVDTGADIRWIAGADYWDTAFNRWIPTDDGLASRYWWTTNDTYKPTLYNSYTYYLGKEEITRSCVSFDEDSTNHMWSVFDQGSSTSESMTVMMVVALNPVQPYQAFYGVLDSGGNPENIINGEERWYPNQDLVNRTACRIYPHRVSMTMGDSTTRTPHDRRPSFNVIGILTMHFHRDGFYTQWHADEDKWLFFKTAVKQLEENANYISHNLLLGRSNGSLVYTANMDVFDINLWTSTPSDTELQEAKTQLKSVYGIA